MHLRVRRSLTFLVSLCAAAVIGTAPPTFTAQVRDQAAQPSPSGALTAHAYVLDWAARSVTATDAAGRVLATAGYGPEPVARRGPFSGSFPIKFNVRQQEDDGTPAEMILSPSASRLVVVDHGPGKDTKRFGWHPSRKSTVAILGARSLRPLAAVEGVWGLPILHRTSADGTMLTLVGPGYESNDAEEGRPAEIVNVDLRRGEVVSRFDLTGRVPPAHDRERWADRTVLAADGRHLYVLDRVANSIHDPAIDAHVLVIDVRSGESVQRLEAGVRPRGLAVDHRAGQILLLSDSPVKEGTHAPGQLRIIRGVEVAGVVDVAPVPLFLRASPDGRTVHVFSREALTTIDAATMMQSGGVRIRRAGLSWSTLASNPGGATSPPPPGRTVRTLDDAGTVSAAAISPDGRRAYALHDGSSQLSIVDLESQTVTARITTGRTSRKIGLELTALAASALSQWTAERQARAMGRDFWFYPTYFVLPATTRIQVGPDGRFVYVVNSQTRDITVVDTMTARVVTHLPTRGYYMQVLPNSRLMAVGHESDLAFIDTGANAVVGPRLKGRHHAVTASPDGREVFVLSHGRVTRLNPQSATPSGEADYLVPTQMVFADSSIPAADEGLPAAVPDPFELKMADGVLPASRWMVLHLHKATKCQGWLYVTDARIGFRATAGDSHHWEAGFDEVREVKTNKMFAGGGSLGSFRVTLRDGANYNFSLNGISADRLVSKLREAIATPGALK